MTTRRNSTGLRTTRIRTRLIALAALPLAALLAACPKDKDKKVAAADTFKVDTTPAKLDSLKSDIGQAAPDTFTPPKLPTAQEATARRIPDAPPELMAAVEREQSFTKFCFQEFGQKTDPTLRGSVAMVVTVGSRGITAARVGASNWSSGAGKSVNRCLEQKARQAWKLEPGVVKPGEYAVPLTFRAA